MVTRRFPLRVLHVLNKCQPGGREQWVLDVASRLDAGIFRSTVLFTGARTEFAADFASAGIRPVFVGEVTGGLESVRLLTLLKMLRPHIVHMHPGSFRFCCLARTVTAAKLITHIHGLPEDSHNRRAFSSYRRLMALSDASVTTSHWLAHRLNAIGAAPGTIRVVYNGVSRERICGCEQNHRFRSAWEIPDDALVVGVVARLVGNKGVDRVLDAFTENIRNGIEAYLVVVGDGPMRPQLEKRAREKRIAFRTRFLGFRRDVVCLLRYFDLLVLASESEGFPLVPLEAACAGVPCLLSDLPIYREILPASLWAWLIPALDVAKWASDILMLLRDSRLRLSLAREQGQALTQFDIAETASAIQQLYLECMATELASTRRPL